MVGSPDYEKRVTIQGEHSGALKVVAVDGDGQIYALMVGADGQVIAQDADGNLQTVMQGEYSGALKTLLCDADGRLLAQLMGMYGSTAIPIACDASGRLTFTDMDQTDINADAVEAATWDASILTLVNNLNRIRHAITDLSGEAWGTFTTSTAALFAKFHATTGHAHTGGAADAPILHHGGLSGLTDDDHNIYALVAGTRAFTGDQSMGSHKLTSVTDPASAQDAATKNYVDAVGKAWAAWTPTLTWGTATPASITTIARWVQAGKIVYITIYIYSPDSNATTGLTISNLPVTVSANQSLYPVLSQMYYDNTATIKLLYGSIASATGNINFGLWSTPTDGQQILVQVSGFYEV